MYQRNYKKRHRLISKSRFTLFIACMMITMIYATNTVLGANTATCESKPTYAQIVVESGDTLWNIASDYGPQGQDLRKVVNEISKVNELSANSSIQPGQLLLVPENIY